MKRKNKLIIMGKLNKDRTNGPTGVIVALSNEFKKKIKLDLVGYNNKSKINYIYMIFKNVILSKKCVINVHTDGFIIPFIVMVFGKINKKNKYFLTVHGIYAIECSYVNNVSKRSLFLERLLYKYFDNIICVSNKLKDDVNLLFNRSNNVFVINNGVYIKKYNYNLKKVNKDNIKLISTGGIKRRKGIYEVINIIGKINKASNIKLFFDIYGSNDDEGALSLFNKVLNKLNLEKYIRYRGIINNKDELYKRYKDADINICTSYYDTFNISVLESMVVGTPTIVSKQCGASRLIKNFKDGFIVDTKKNYEKEFTNIIYCILNNSNEFEKIRLNAISTSKKYSWDKVANKYLDLFKGYW